jgi:hypothetical protein
MITVYVCSVHMVGRIHQEELWSRDKYERAMCLRTQLRLVEDSCPRCLERARQSLETMWLQLTTA